ncbi:MAG: 4Fe-4S binding protein, partial [Theionarchaea archaeon]|nr:4Fe-4S binding protein [Theionarchaea archaeon]
YLKGAFPHGQGPEKRVGYIALLWLYEGIQLELIHQWMLSSMINIGWLLKEDGSVWEPMTRRKVINPPLSEYPMQVVLDSKRCDGCGMCVKVCHKGPRIFDMKKKEIKDTAFCNACLLCIDVCPRSALSIIR